MHLPAPDSPLRSPAFLLVLGLVGLVAIVLRVGDLSAPGTLIEREYRSAIIARSLYFRLQPPPSRGASAWPRSAGAAKVGSSRP